MPKNKIECRGRNGWFNYHSHYVFVSKGEPVIPEDPEHLAFVDISSIRVGQYAPIRLIGSAPDIIEVLKDIIQKLEQGMQETGTPDPQDLAAPGGKAAKQ